MCRHVPWGGRLEPGAAVSRRASVLNVLLQRRFAVGSDQALFSF